MTKILITGFEAFGKDCVNASWEGVKHLPEHLQSIEIIKRKLPVEYHRVGGCLIHLIQEACPDAVLCIGQASGRAAVTPEKVAINWMSSKTADNAGVKQEGAYICESKADAYFATIPVEQITAALKDAGIPAQISYTAGTYVCNRTMYELLDYVKHNAPKIKGGFIHVPCMTNQAADSPNLPSMSRETITAALETAILVVAEELSKDTKKAEQKE